MTLQFNNNFAKFIGKCENVEVISATNKTYSKYGTTKKIILQVKDNNNKPIQIILYNNTKNNTKSNPIPHLKDFLEIETKEFNEEFKKIKNEKNDLKNQPNSFTNFLNKKLKENNEKKIQINATYDEKNDVLWAFNIATEIFEIVPFYEVKKVIDDYFNIEEYKIEETEFNGVKVWNITYSNFKIKDEDFITKIRITSGNNKKKSGIKVILYIKIGSCENSVKCTLYNSIKHTTNYKQILIGKIIEVIELAETIPEIIKNSMEKEVNIEKAIEYINSLNFGLKNENKVNLIRNNIIERLNFEFNQNKNNNVWGVSQSLSYIGTHSNLDELNISKQTLQKIQYNAYEILI